MILRVFVFGMFLNLPPNIHLTNHLNVSQLYFQVLLIKTEFDLNFKNCPFKKPSHLILWFIMSNLKKNRIIK